MRTRRFFKLPQNFNNKKRVRKPGNTITEYTLVALLAIAGSVGGWAIFGGGLNFSMDALKGDMASQIGSAQTAQAKRAAEAEAREKAAQLAQTPPDGLPNAAQARASGNAMDDLVDQGQDPIQVAGSGGNTREVLNALRLSIKRAIDAGDLPPEQAGLANQLANKGHELATMQGILERARFDAMGSASVYDNTRLTYNGQTYSPQQLARHLTNEIEVFAKLQWDTENSGLPPSVVSVVSIAAPKIKDYAASARSIAISTDEAMAVGVGENKGDPQNVVYADGTHGQSGNVCRANGQTDSGKRCNP